MSFILDALKKSENDRQRQSGPGLFEVKVAAPKARFPMWAVALAALLAVNIGVVGWLVLRQPSRASVANAAPAPVMASSAQPAATASASPVAPAAVASSPAATADAPSLESSAAPVTALITDRHYSGRRRGRPASRALSRSIRTTTNRPRNCRLRAAKGTPRRAPRRVYPPTNRLRVPRGAACRTAPGPACLCREAAGPFHPAEHAPAARRRFAGRRGARGADHHGWRRAVIPRLEVRARARLTYSAMYQRLSTCSRTKRSKGSPCPERSYTAR